VLRVGLQVGTRPAAARGAAAGLAAVPARSAVVTVGLCVNACSRQAAAGLARRAALPVTADSAQAAKPAGAAVLAIGRQVHTGAPARGLAGRADELTLAAQAALARSARSPAVPAVAQVALQVDAVVVAASQAGATEAAGAAVLAVALQENAGAPARGLAGRAD